MRIWLTAGTLALALGALVWTQDPGRIAAPQAVASSPWQALSGIAEAFPDPPSTWNYRFPKDHGVHSDQFGEFWLFTGHLDGAGHGAIGFQLAFFRLALAQEMGAHESAWATRQVYRAQFILEESGHSGVWTAERFSREAIDLAGAEGLRVWVEGWTAAYAPECRCYRLHASTGDMDLELTFHSAQGEAVPIAGIPGLDIGNPGSHGYWWPGWRAEGRLNRAGESHVVQGQAMVEHLWGRRLPVAQGQLTLNRLWLELADGSTLRCLQLRRRGPGGVPLGQCLRLSAANELTLLPREALQPSGPALYDHPLRWTLEAPDATLSLQAKAARPRPPPEFLLPGWSGLLQAQGTSGGEPTRGWGWLDLGGY